MLLEVFGLLLWGLGRSADESVAAYTPHITWQIVELAGVPVTVPITLDLSERGVWQGQAPCNRWSAAQSAPYPWVDLGPIRATRRACQELALEAQFFAALEQAHLVEVSGRIMILTLTDGTEVIAEARD